MAADGLAEHYQVLEELGRKLSYGARCANINANHRA